MLKQDYDNMMAEINELPQGGITYKKINGKRYAYYQWREEGHQHSRRVKDDEFEYLSQGIARRKELQSRIKNSNANNATTKNPEYQFRCMVRVGEDLENFVKPVLQWKKRECYMSLHEYVYGDVHDRVYVLYGLRRTGKTTMIRQLVSEMDAGMRSHAAFIQVHDGLTLADVNRDLKHLEKAGYRYVFIDEVTLMEDFISGAALFSDIFAASGMKIVLSGTDSLGFMLAEDEELYDRCVMSHTTFIPYREFEIVLGIRGIDEYIHYGGTMSISGRKYNDSIFSSEKRTNEYVDSAIAHNIQHSLKSYNYGNHFRSLRELYENDELTSVINRVVEDINHRFTVEVMTRNFRSNDLRISAGNLRKDAENPTDVLDHVTIDNQLKELLEIRNRQEQKVEINETVSQEIREYLDLLDLTVDIDTRFAGNYNRFESRTAFTQPGLRYAQAEALIRALLDDDKFREISLAERNSITDRILDEIKGRMMEDIVLLETMLFRKDAEVFCLKFAVGEFDMVVFYPEKACCEIYEIKHSTKAVMQQCKYLMNEKKCAETQFRYGKIIGKYVIYRGESTKLRKSGIEGDEDITYLNVEEYLKSLRV